MSYHPYIIRHSLVPGSNFEAKDPSPGPKVDGIIHSYLDRNDGGKIKFSPRANFCLKRLTLHVADAAEWSVSLLHTGADVEPENEVVIADSSGSLSFSAMKSESLDGKTFSFNLNEFFMVPGDVLMVRTVGATEKVYVEAFALPAL